MYIHVISTHVHIQTYLHIRVYIYTCINNIDYLLSECEVCTEKYLPEVFASEKTEGKYFPAQTEQTRLIRNLLYGFWFLFSSLLTKFCVRELAA